MGTLREEGFVPVRLQGDWLPDKGFQRRLLKLVLDDGEELLAMPKQADRTVASKLVEVSHVGFVRWPRDPEYNPLKLNIPVTVVNEDKMSVVKRGGYVHNMFSCLGGLPCTAETPDFPHTTVADMDLADSKGDFRWEHLEKQLPPGVKLLRGLRGFTEHPNFLVARAKKVRGS